MLKSLHRIVVIAHSSYREAVRDRTILGTAVVALMIIVFGFALGELSLNQNFRVVRDIGLACISIFAMLIAVFLGSSMLYRELDQKTVYLVLSKPIHRYEFLAGKIIGITLSCSTFVTLSGSVFVGVLGILVSGSLLFVWMLFGQITLATVALLYFKDQSRVMLIGAPVSLCLMLTMWAMQKQEVLPIAGSLLLVQTETLLLSSIAVFFSAFTSPLFTGVFTSGVWIIGRSVGEMSSLKSRALPPFVVDILRESSAYLPNFHLYVPDAVVFAEQVQLVPYLLNSILYGLAYSSVVFLLAALLFRRREFL